MVPNSLYQEKGQDSHTDFIDAIYRRGLPTHERLLRQKRVCKKNGAGYCINLKADLNTSSVVKQKLVYYIINPDLGQVQTHTDGTTYCSLVLQAYRRVATPYDIDTENIFSRSFATRIHGGLFIANLSQYVMRLGPNIQLGYNRYNAIIVIHYVTMFLGQF